MKKAFLFSLLLFTFAVPMLAARVRSRPRALQIAVVGTIALCVAYLLGLLFVLPVLR